MSDPQGMSIVVRVVTRWLFGLILIFGLAVALFGHVTPGGGFAGGTIVACAFVLAILAFGGSRGPGAAFARWASSLDATGALSFLVLAILGYTAGSFLHQWAARGELFTLGSTPSIVLLNLAILLKVGAGLFAGFIAVAVFEGAAGSEKGADA
ncbi:MAG: MnhB domain-containing protein [Planctomycetota bacterium]|nr:MnhB domain-containing protein [Planctomycetota bacterium]